MSQYSVTEYELRVRQALQLAEDTIWVEFGRPTIAWNDDSNPPNPAPGAVDVESPYLYVKATQNLCRPVSDEEYDAADPTQRFIYNGVKVVYVPLLDAYTQLARWVLVRVVINPVLMGCPTGTYRQKRICVDVNPTTGHENDTWLTPANVQFVGHRAQTEYNSPVTITSTTVKTVYMLMTV